MNISSSVKIIVIFVVLNIGLHLLFGASIGDVKNSNPIIINGLIAFLSALPISIYASKKQKNEV